VPKDAERDAAQALRAKRTGTATARPRRPPPLAGPALRLLRDWSVGRERLTRAHRLPNAELQPDERRVDGGVAAVRRRFARHQDVPYATRAERELLARGAGISEARLSSWLRRQRRRQWRPAVMAEGLGASELEGGWVAAMDWGMFRDVSVPTRLTGPPSTRIVSCSAPPLKTAG
jgi:hypothetical protein